MNEGGDPARSRARLLLALIVVVPLGFATKGYGGPGAQWVNASAGGALYVVFWTLAAALVWPRAAGFRLVGSVLAITCLLEALQRWHPPWLERVRETAAGQAALGSTFSWADYPPYFGGALLAWLLLAWTRPGGGRNPLH